MQSSDARDQLNSDDIDVRRAAAAALVKGGIDGLTALVEALPKNYQAEDALLRAKNPDTLRLLAPHLASNDSHLRNIAAAITSEILAAHGSSVAPPDLGDLLFRAIRTATL